MSKYLTPVLVLAVAVLAVALFIKGGEVISAYDVAAANYSEATLNITGVAPTMESVQCFDYNLDDLGNMGANPMALKGGRTAEIICNGTGNDENGAVEINGTTSGSISGRVYETTQGAACSADTTNCYVNATCAPIAVKNETAHYFECRFYVWYHADNTSGSGSWTGWMNVSDDTTGSGTDTDVWDMDKLLAVGVPGILAFGTAVPGEHLAVNTSHTVTNYGNVEMDLKLNGSSPGMTCDSAQDIPTTQIRYNCTNSQGTEFDGWGTNLTTAAASTGCTVFNLAESSGTAGPPTESTKDTYWGVEVPAGVSGDCQGTIQFTAILTGAS